MLPQVLQGRVVVIDGEAELTSQIDGGCNLLQIIDGEAEKVLLYRDADYYTGDYEVIPDTVVQVLPTKEKLMSDDVTVTEIKTYEVSNAYGTTFYIAKMEENNNG